MDFERFTRLGHWISSVLPLDSIHLVRWSFLARERRKSLLARSAHCSQMSCCSFFDQRLVLEKRVNLVLQRESTDEPFGLDVARVDGQLHIQEVMSEPRLLEKSFSPTA